MARVARALSRHREYALGAALAVLALTAIAFLLAPRRYSAEASLAWAARAPASAGTDATALAARQRRAIAGALTAPALAARVADQLGLVPEPGPALADHLSVQAKGAPTILYLTYAAADPGLAAAVLNRLVDQFVASQAAGGTPDRAGQADRAALEAARTEMLRTQAVADDRRTVAGLLGRDDQARRLERELARRDRDLAAARGDATSRHPAGAGAAVPSALQLLRTQAAELAAERDQLQQRYGPRHPAMLDAEARLAAVNARLSADTARTGDLAAAERIGRRRVADHLRAVARLRDDATRLDAAARAAADRYDALRRAAPPLPPPARPSFTVAHAEVPSAPDRPDGRLFAAVGLVAAILAGAAAAVARELASPGSRTVSHAEDELPVPTLGKVPEAPPGLGLPPADLVIAAGQSDFATELRRLADALRLGEGAQAPRSLAVASAVAGEGKTTISIALARSAALSGLRTLLIDCDARRPAASQALAPAVAAGLAEVVRGEARLEDARVEDAASGLWVLAIRPGSGAEGGMIGSATMTALVDEAVRSYDLVVLDTAPVLALAESRSVARLVDTVLLVARWKRTEVRAVRLALDLLGRAGASVAGLCLTRVPT